MAVLRFATHLWFDADALEAANRYVELLPDSRVDRVLPAPPGVRGAEEGAPFIVDLTLMGQHYTFLNGGPLFPFDSQVSLYVLCETQEEVDHYWSALLEGGGSEVQCGWLTDRFGLSWQVVPRGMDQLFADPDRDRADRAFQAMMKMRKLDIEELRRAADGVAAG
jgi:predicted 3-demethylubiquinone-9 3-methyltransferase (glyoxalase superfamily)